MFTFALFFVVFWATSAHAGGSWFEPDGAPYEPGDVVTLVGYTGGGQLGWIEDGPFFGYLRPTSSEGTTRGANGDTPVGEILVEETGLGGWQTLRASITFALPGDLAPGVYEFVYCNEGCVTGLGDLIGATVYVGVDPPIVEEASSSTSTMRTATTAPASTATAVTDRPGSEGDSMPSGAYAGAGIVALGTITMVERRSRRLFSAVRTSRT